MELSELRDDDGLLCIRIPESDGVVSFMDLFRFNVGIDIPGWCTYYVYISTIEVLFYCSYCTIHEFEPGGL